MKVLHNESLKNRTTFHVGGVAENFWIPDSAGELKDLLVQLEDQPLWVLSGGSNLLINDKKVFRNVVSMKNVDKTLEHLGNGKFYIGASNRIQKVINFVNAEGYGGFEELIGLPAMFGGIIYMNAGIGPRDSVKFNIGDFVERVKVLAKSTYDTNWIDASECGFGYRQSIFQNDEYIILGAEVCLPHQDLEISNKRIEQRHEYIKKNQEFGKGCFGSCFCLANGRLLRIVSVIPYHIWGGVHQSSQSANWLVNTGSCTFKQVMRLINFSILLHKITFQKNRLEVRIWE